MKLIPADQREILSGSWNNYSRLFLQNQPLKAFELSTLQINLGKLCNQTCRHCHVGAGPARTEVMSESTAEKCLEVISQIASIKTVDITGGAPEMCPSFRKLASTSRRLGKRVIDRCNLSILFEKGHEDLASFLSSNQIEIIASLPSLSAITADNQRGKGVFLKSIEALQILNDLGYGKKIPLYLVYNPQNTELCPPQKVLENQYRAELASRFGIEFTGLYAIQNIPVSRHLEYLLQADKLHEYLQVLADSFNPSALSGLMCRNSLSVSYDGRLYDCDFNQMLEMPLDYFPLLQNINQINLEGIINRTIRLSSHCLGCSAGSGSSCTGSITE